MKLPDRFSDAQSEAGETLIETLISSTLIALVVVAFIGGIATTVLGSQVHRQQADENAGLVAVMEHLKSPTAVARVACATTHYNTAAQNALTAHYDSKATPAGRRGTLALTVEYQAVGSGGALAWDAVTCAENATPPAPTMKMQRINLTLTSYDGAVSPTLSFVKGEF